MKVRFNRWYNAVLTALLTMLGYGCSSTDENRDVDVCMVRHMPIISSWER